MSDTWDDYDYDPSDQRDPEPEILTSITKVRETEKAVLIKHKLRTAWFPKSLIIAMDDDAIEYEGWFDPTWQKDLQAKRKVTEIEGDFI